MAERKEGKDEKVKEEGKQRGERRKRKKMKCGSWIRFTEKEVPKNAPNNNK
jgi:hypothetical protein